MTEEPKYILISKLEADGTLKELVQSGYCNPSIFRNLEIYRHLDALLKTGSSKTDAVLQVEVSFKMCKASVYNVIKSFK